MLPTEAQWEYAGRAGSDKPWSTGEKPDSLFGHANVADKTAERSPVVSRPSEGFESFDDGHATPARVGTFLPNAFGLHDMHGNVSEWCRDWLGSYTQIAAPGDGLRSGHGPGSGYRVFRGGSFISAAVSARSAYSAGLSAETRASTVGIRAARAITE